MKRALSSLLINSPAVKNFNLEAAGGSMRPIISSGETLNCRKPTREKAPRFGQVAVIRDNNDLLVHRVIWKKRVKQKWHVLTKGDFRLAADGWIEGDRILAEVAGKAGGRKFNRPEEVLVGTISLAIYLMPNFLKNFLRKLGKSTKLVDRVNR